MSMKWIHILVLVLIWATELGNPMIDEQYTFKDEVCGKHSSGPGWKRCLENRCLCCNSTVDCSKSRLTYIPVLPNGSLFLNFSYNNLREITDERFFSNVTNLIGIDLGSNNLKNISSGAFKPLRSLRILLLSYNFQLTYASLFAIFSVKTLEHLDIRHSDIKQLPPLHDFHLSSLLLFLLHENRMGEDTAVLNLTLFDGLPNLQRLGLATNMISKIHVEKPVVMTHLEFQSNGLFDFPKTCIQAKESFYPHLKQLYLMENLIRYLPDDADVCLPSLTLLQLNGNHIQHFVSDMFNRNRFPRLFLLLLEGMNTKVQSIQAYAFNNSNLRILSMMYNNIDFSSWAMVSKDSFAGIPKLEELQVSHNYFSEVNESRFLQLFGGLNSLQNLSLGSTDFTRFTPNTFLKFKNLQLLELYSSHISDIPDGTFDELRNLRYLYLYGNQISQIRETTFSKDARRRLKTLDLSNNPFVCSCDILWFQKWMTSNISLFKHSWGKYVCANLPNLHVSDFYVNEQSCLLNHDAYVFMVISISILLTVLMFFGFLYHCRWHIRLVLYESFRGGPEGRKHRLQSQNFKFDLFVSFDADDLHWVCTHLVPELEDRLKLRLCIHQRDFIPGKNIVDNIADSVEASKKVLMLFSRSFAHSRWCQFELALCLRHVMEQDDQLVVICMDEFQSRDVTRTMLAVLKTTTFIQWNEAAESQASFWGRLHVALDEIIHC